MDWRSLLVTSPAPTTSRTRRWGLTLPAALMLCTLCGCGAVENSSYGPNSAPTPSDEQSLSSEHFGAALGSISDAKSEYLATAGSLAQTLPHGVTFPETMPGDWDSMGQFEAGFGEMQAALYWQCAWLSKYVGASDQGDTAGKNLAIDKLMAWAHIDVVKEHVDPDSIAVWEHRFLDPARSGDDRLVREMASSCG